VAVLDIRFAFSDNGRVMAGSRDGFIYERTLLLLGEAAAHLHIETDLDEVAPTRLQDEYGALVPEQEYQAALRRIFGDGRETLGIDLASAIPLESAGLWGFLLRSSPTFGDMLRRAVRFIEVFFRYTRIEIEEAEHTVRFICEHPDPSPFGNREQEICFFLGQWLTWGRCLIGDSVIADAVEMRWKGPAHRSPFATFFGCSVKFDGDRDLISFSRQVLDFRLPGNTPELRDMFDCYAAAMISHISPEKNFVDQVCDALSEGFLCGESDQTSVAKRLGVTVRTLHRRLGEHDTSFRVLRSEYLQSRAEQLLQDQRLPIAEVSYLLGYAEPSNFHRAFRKWKGTSPAEWREQSIA
jgi:AraC-like DNA-binding protein